MNLENTNDRKENFDAKIKRIRVEIDLTNSDIEMLETKIESWKKEISDIVLLDNFSLKRIEDIDHNISLTRKVIKKFQIVLEELIDHIMDTIDKEKDIFKKPEPLN